jgi:hypothetical protein
MKIFKLLTILTLAGIAFGIALQADNNKNKKKQVKTSKVTKTKAPKRYRIPTKTDSPADANRMLDDQTPVHNSSPQLIDQNKNTRPMTNKDLNSHSVASF